MKRYLNKKWIIISIIVGLVMPFLAGFGFNDGSLIPNFVAVVLWGVPGIVANFLLGGQGIAANGLFGIGGAIFLLCSIVYYFIIITVIRAIVLAIKK